MQVNSNDWPLITVSTNKPKDTGLVISDVKRDHSRLGRNVQKEGYVEHHKSFNGIITDFDDRKYSNVKPAQKNTK